VILDNYAAHKHPKVIAWLARHPRFTFHFTPTSASWLNAIEDFFAILTKRRIKRGAFCSIIDLQGAMNRYIAEHNLSPKPFAWTKDPEKIMCGVQFWSSIRSLIQSASYPLSARTSAPAGRSLSSISAIGASFI
jgi:hypothetical protein